MEQLLQLRLKAKQEMQELGKVYLTNGSQISKNHGAGIQIRHTMLEIDNN